MATPPQATGAALVTGASSGFGVEFARLLAADGYDVVLVARSGDKLEALATGLRQAHDVRALVLAEDLSDPAAPDRIAEVVLREAFTIDILINNAGFAQYGSFLTTDERVERKQVQVNVAALTHLTKLFVPGMVERGHGRVLNIASTAAFFPGPLMAVYYATKNYVLAFSVGLSEELRGTGVTVTAFCPGPTATGFESRATAGESGLFKGKTLRSAAEVAAEGYAAMKAGRPILVPGFGSKIAAFGSRLIPRTLAARMVERAQGSKSR